MATVLETIPVRHLSEAAIVVSHGAAWADVEIGNAGGDDQWVCRTS